VSHLSAENRESLPLPRDGGDDPVTIALFCAIGLLITLNVMLRYPDFGVLIAQLNCF